MRAMMVAMMIKGGDIMMMKGRKKLSKSFIRVSC
jgi:hypothetical protein